MAYSLRKIYGSLHSARVIYYAIYTQRVFRKGLFITQYIYNVHSERRRGRFIAPASSTKTIGCNLQNITDYNANNGNKIWEKQYCVTICITMLCKKPPFCAAKVWFLACKNHTFTLQKPPFCIARRGNYITLCGCSVVVFATHHHVSALVFLL